MEQLFCSPQFEAFSPTLQPERIKFTLRKIQTISLYINPTVEYFKYKREIKILMLDRDLNSIVLECGIKTFYLKKLLIKFMSSNINFHTHKSSLLTSIIFSFRGDQRGGES